MRIKELMHMYGLSIKVSKCAEIADSAFYAEFSPMIEIKDDSVLKSCTGYGDTMFDAIHELLNEASNNTLVMINDPGERVYIKVLEITD